LEINNKTRNDVKHIITFRREENKMKCEDAHKAHTQTQIVFNESRPARWTNIMYTHYYTYIYIYITHSTYIYGRVCPIIV